MDKHVDPVHLARCYTIYSSMYKAGVFYAAAARLVLSRVMFFYAKAGVFYCVGGVWTNTHDHRINMINMDLI